MPPYPWQQEFWQRFIAMVDQDALPHAILVTAPEGLGAEKLIHAVVHFLLCRSPVDGLACMRCKACELAVANTHPDHFELGPEEPGKAIKVDQVRALTDFVAKTAQQGGRKLVSIVPAEAMNINAANSLLKCLEEPSGDTVILLLTHSPSLLMPTIRSRCAGLTLSPPPQPESVRWLGEQGVEHPEALLLQTGNAPLTALDWWQNETYREQEKMLRQWLSFSRNEISLSQVVAVWSKEEPLSVLDSLLRWLNILVKLHIADREGGFLTDVWQDFAETLAATPSSSVFLYRDLVTERKRQVLSRVNLNPTLVIEELLLAWQHALRSEQSIAGEVSV